MLEKKILIADNEQTFPRVLCQALTKWSFVPVEADNLQSALELFDREQPFITMLDLNFADGNGLDLLRMIKRRQPGANVIIVKGDVLVENTIAALRAGACDFIAKPINLAELKIKIDNCSDNNESNLKSISSTNGLTKNFSFEHIKGASPQTKELILLARKWREARFQVFCYRESREPARICLPKRFTFLRHAPKNRLWL